MQIFDHDREELRAATRLRAASDPPPLPPTTPSGLRHRLIPAQTHAESARALLGCGAILLAVTLIAGTWIVLARDPMTLGWGVLLGFLMLLVLVALWSVWEGIQARRRARQPGYAVELDDPDLTTGRTIGITVVQERGGSLANVSVTLVCDETIIEDIESPCTEDVDAAHRRRMRHRVNAAGQHVDMTRIPTTSRIFEREVIREPLLDGSQMRVTKTGEVTLDPLVEPSGATLDHSVKWHLRFRATMQDGSTIRDDYDVRVRRE